MHIHRKLSKWLFTACDFFDCVEFCLSIVYLPMLSSVPVLTVVVVDVIAVDADTHCVLFVKHCLFNCKFFYALLCTVVAFFRHEKKNNFFFSSRAQFSCPSEIVNALKKIVRLFNSDSKAIQFIHICLYTDGVKVHISKLRIHMEIVCSVNNMLAIYYTFQINNENMYIVATLITFPLKNNCYYAYRERSQIKALQQLRMQKSGKSTHMLMTLEPKHHMLLRCNFSHLFFFHRENYQVPTDV